MEYEHEQNRRRRRKVLGENGADEIHLRAVRGKEGLVVKIEVFLT